MRAQSILAFALLQLPSCTAAPTDSTASLEHGKRCMTQSEISAFQASWPAIAGTGPELDACDEDITLKRSLLSSSEIEDLVRRYLHVEQVAKRSTETNKAKRCMTEEEIKQFQDSWPANGGIGPVLIPCSEFSGNGTFSIDFKG